MQLRGDGVVRDGDRVDEIMSDNKVMRIDPIHLNLFLESANSLMGWLDTLSDPDRKYWRDKMGVSAESESDAIRKAIEQYKYWRELLADQPPPLAARDAGAAKG